MNWKKWIYIFLLLPISVTGQKGEFRQTVCLIADIPLVMESDHGIISFDQNKVLEISPGRIRISLASRKKEIEFDHLLQLSKPLPAIDQINSLYAIYSNSPLQASWSPGKSRNNDVLIDTVLNPNDSLKLVWKTQENKIIQKIILKTKKIKPIIIGYRVNDYYDSIVEGQKIRVLKRKNTLPKGFTALSKDSIDIRPGGIIELKLKSYPLLTDTITYYRVLGNNNAIIYPWKSTSHIFSLPELRANNNYTLEIAYPNQSETSKYFLIHQPFWYQRTWIQWLLVSISILLIVILVRLYYRRKIKLITSQRQRLEDQLTTIQSQLNPHFIFNALSSIEGLVSGGQNKLANEYLTTFSLIMRETLKNADKLLISLKEEIALLEKYISIEQLRFGFNFSISIDDHIHPDEIQVPPMLAQPLIENAVKHGAGSNGNLSLAIRKDSNNMLIQVTNSKTAEDVKVQTAGGYGLAFTRERLKHFSSLHPNTPIEFDFIETDNSFVATLRFVNWFA